jgi:hypothetical protein
MSLCHEVQVVFCPTVAVTNTRTATPARNAGPGGSDTAAGTAVADTDCCGYFQWWCHTTGSAAVVYPDTAVQSGNDSQQSV